MGLLRDDLPRHTYGVVGVYRGNELEVAVAGLRIDDQDGILVQFPHRQSLVVGDLVTVQLDNRMDVQRLSAAKPVYRTSYKGEVVATDEGSAELRPVQFQLVYSDRVVSQFSAPGYRPPLDTRPVTPLSPTSLGLAPIPSLGEASSSLGVLLTLAPERPHTTVMAFLSSEAGDVFLITDPRSYKVQNLVRDPRAWFAVDDRATYDLERPLDWAYRIQPFVTRIVPRTTGLFEQVRDQFVAKSPWEGAFFTAPSSILIHLEPLS